MSEGLPPEKPWNVGAGSSRDAVSAEDARFRELADAMPQIVFSADAEGNVDYFNRRWYEYTGFPPGSIGNEAWKRVHTDEGLRRAMRAWPEAVRNGTSYDIEYLLRRSDGVYRWHLGRALPVRDAAGTIVRWFGTNTDIHDHKLALEQLADIIKTALDCIVCMDHRGRITEWNPAAEATFGYRREEAVGRDLAETIIPPQLRERHRAGLANYLATGKGLILGRRIEIVALRRDGSEFPAELSIIPIAMADPPAFTGYIRDITERKQAEQEREHLLVSERSARTDAEAANRMKDEFLATLSHELRTPLNAILGWSRILKAEAGGSDILREGLDTIERNARSQSQIIDDLLDMSRIISGKVRLDVREIELADVVSAAIETVRPASEAREIRIQAVLDPLAHPICGDANRLEQVFWNLLTNAVKFTPKGGRVQVRLERINSHVEVSIIDTGEGIDPNFLPYVFDRFSQAQASSTRRYGGLGLGLGIVKQLVELHGGAVRAKSLGLGKGSTFTVELPLTVIHPDPECVSDRRHPEHGPGRIDRTLRVSVAGVKVLAVDDESDARALIRRLLENCEAVVTTAGSVAEAAGLLESQRFDVLISDIGMPEADGYEMIRRLRSLPADRGGQTPAIALTAYARAEDRVKSVVAGFQMHIAKPVEPDELIAMVASLTGRMGN